MTTPRVYTLSLEQSSVVVVNGKTYREKDPVLKDFILLSDHKEVVREAEEKYKKLGDIHTVRLAELKTYIDRMAASEALVKRQAEEIERLKVVIDKWSAANLRQTEAIEKLRDQLYRELIHQSHAKERQMTPLYAAEITAILQEAK